MCFFFTHTYWITLFLEISKNNFYIHHVFSNLNKLSYKFRLVWKVFWWTKHFSLNLYQHIIYWYNIWSSFLVRLVIGYSHSETKFCSVWKYSNFKFPNIFFSKFCKFLKFSVTIVVRCYICLSGERRIFGAMKAFILAKLSHSF